MTEARTNLAFGKKRKQHILILASGEKIRHVTIRPLIVVPTLLIILVMSLGFIGSTAYLVFRDDMLGAMIARQSRMQKDYEDRIAALRSQVDQITSRQLLDQQAVEKKVETLLAQQNALSSRHGRANELLNEDAVSAQEDQSATPSANAFAPQKKASLSGGVSAIYRALRGPEKGSTLKGSLTYSDNKDAVSGRALTRMLASLNRVESEQLGRIASLTTGAKSRADAMADIIRSTGLKIDDKPDDAIGGPFVEASTNPFQASLADLDDALDRLETVRGTAERLPLGNPAPGRDITSRFGNRMDPFLGRPALHTGIDFRAETGADVRATGAGTVSFAGYSGGYGNMVEVDHGKGVTTRYGHLSQILVRTGEKIELSDVIGKAGSTGRSTGPHVHYEVRLNDEAVDPMRFLVAGTELKTYLQ
ncbi:murein DD-endopeptidase MepM/ murein hydrolase activator NlpD [Agrobacterium larrymoorei]|uniref:Murein DD-endopeptidase MepM/ murein hydrolase activator NlpD n=1 Tax=Agrobacterium larrymoorei TaxID=160699 RepID=A0AAJ2ESF2_9HYPH|nr:peptidoglycan DD-metalloendopeptidase family protein [Agrobacterium larrymoorei]MDR6101408.1 murein DD-endopeptidase MepM/ murein hydrolase activator NlpD [Agrobacterium larrymoorei]